MSFQIVLLRLMVLVGWFWNYVIPDGSTTI